jgi:iron complex outermembrane recepter protein
MKRSFKKALLASCAIVAGGAPAYARPFDIPRGNLEQALDTYTAQTGLDIVVSTDQIRGIHSSGAKGDLADNVALARILSGTGFIVRQHPGGAIGIVRNEPADPITRLTDTAPMRVAAAATTGIESVVVTSSKIKGDIQTVPIAITALSQEQLTSRQIAGGPDLVKEVPNLTFSKTNFSGYNLQIRGIGTQAISVTTDPAVAVAFNDIPFIRNHFFEQEFYDVSQVEVLRGPQGTLYGRNATAGVVNLIAAKPTDQFEAMASADIGNYHNRRFEGMVNIPIVDDRLDLRVAGEWTKRDGYSFDTLTNQPIDGRDLWSSRVTLGWKPASDLQTYLVWEHFSENDDRIRSSKQLCETSQAPTSIYGQAVPLGTSDGRALTGTAFGTDSLSQGCTMTSLYAPSAFEVPNGFSLPYVLALGLVNDNGNTENVNPYASTTQSTNLRDIQSTIPPSYKAKNDTVELNADYAITPALTFTSQTGYNQDFLWSAEDYNRFDTAPGIFSLPNSYNIYGAYFFPDPAAGTNGIRSDAAIFCDPQLGCSDRIVAEDLSEEHAWQLSQEFRLASNFSGPLNFSAGGNYLHYETEENYYVFINALTAYSVLGSTTDAHRGLPRTPDNSYCLIGGYSKGTGFQNPNPINGGGDPLHGCVFIDTNPISSLNNKGHNYFLSQNPYDLNSYAGFGEAYYKITDDLKLTGGLRWTVDKKHFIDIPSQVIARQVGYPVTGIVDQQWDQLTGRAVADWTPKLDFTDQTLLYGSYSHGYKAGGANPPGAVFLSYSFSNTPFADHPLTFRPEFVDAYELGSKNTLLDGALTLNGDVFYYNYKDYQISEIVDRTSINLNFNATVKGAELETTWEPVPGLKFSFAGGYEDTRIANGQSSVDLMDRTAGTPGWMVVKPFPTDASNCILPLYVVAALLAKQNAGFGGGAFACELAYDYHFDPLTRQPYTAYPSGPGIPAGYAGFDPVSPNATNFDNYAGFNAGPVPNNGEGFAKNVGGNALPNAPHFTTSLTADYTMPVSEDWAATLHSDFYWQSQSFARVFNDRPYDKIRGYSNVNLALIITSASGWQVMGYLKNVFDTTAITGDFLNSDDSGLTTNVFLTDPRLYGVRVTKNF